MADAVLRVADIAAGHFPTKCVLTGVPTSQATHVWAIASRDADRTVALFGTVGVWAMRAAGRQTLHVPLPIATGPFEVWHRRAVASAAIACFGLVFLLASPLRGGPALAISGLAIMAAAALMRTRAHRRRWVSAELHAEQGRVIIHRAHPAFDAEARTLFLRHLNR